MNISVQNLSKRFNREWIFRDITFQFSIGNTYAITGPNGAGKSTLLQVLSGLVPPSNGNIAYQDKHGKSVAVEDVYKSIVFAGPYMDLIEEFTLKEHLEFHFQLKKPRNDQTIQSMMTSMYLEHARDKQILNFSSGMRQRLKLALAFYTQADIVLLDEPGTNLDEQAFAWYRNELNRLPHDTTVIIASNDTNEYPESTINFNLTKYK